MNSLQNKSIDLYQSFFQKEKLTSSEINKRIMIATPIMLTAAVVIVSGFFVYGRVQLGKQHEPVAAYLADSASAELYNKAVELQATKSQLQEMYRNLEQAVAAVESYPSVDKSLLEIVYNSRPDKMFLESIEYSADTGVLTITGEALDIGDPADYVEKLKASGRFAEVDYTGYSSNKEKEKQAGLTTDSQAWYKFVAMGKLLPAEEVQP